MSEDKHLLEERILAFVAAVNKAKVPCEIVELSSDGTIRTGKWPQAKGGTAAADPAVEDFFAKHMGKEASRHG